MADKQQAHRIRGRALQRLRAAHFALSPLCVMCQAAGKVTVATELDHIVALANGGTNDRDNYQSLCAACHESKTLQDLKQKPRMEIGEDGWPVEAKPVGPRWKRAG